MANSTGPRTQPAVMTALFLREYSPPTPASVRYSRFAALRCELRSGRRAFGLAQFFFHVRNLIAQPGCQLELQFARGSVHLFRQFLYQ